MANHFTPEELATELGTGTRDVIQLCVKEGIPIYKGKIDRSLLTAVMRTKGIQLPKTESSHGLAARGPGVRPRRARQPRPSRTRRRPPGRQARRRGLARLRQAGVLSPASRSSRPASAPGRITTEVAHSRCTSA